MEDPFAGPAPAEVQLERAPLTHVLAQVRFQTILALNEVAGIAGFQKEIRANYPVFRQEEVREITLLQKGEIRTTPQNVWRFADSSDGWTISVGAAFIALETRVYTNHTDLLERLGTICRTAEATFGPKLVDRLGVRYVNRVQGSSLDRLRELVRPEILGIANTVLSDRVHLNLTETRLSLPGGDGNQMMTLRYGLLPAQSTYDPEAVELSDSLSWVLDVDTYREGRIEFSADLLSDIAASLADQSSRVFRWVVTDEFLREYGRQP